MTTRDRNRFLICLGLAVAIGVLMSVSFARRLLPGVDNLQNVVTDATIFRGRDNIKASKVVLVHMDEKSVAALKDKYGRVFSWPRSLHAQVLRNLADAGARVVTYDVLFDAPACSADQPQPCQEDVDFANAIDYARNSKAVPGGTQVILAEVGSPPEPESNRPGEPLSYKDVIPPLPLLASKATALAHAHANPDDDGTMRKMPLLATLKGNEVPSLSLQSVALYLRRPKVYDSKGDGFIFEAGHVIPTDSNFDVQINYLGKPSHLPDTLRNPPVPTVSFSDVLNNTFDKSAVKDKVVYIGLTAIGFADDYWTPTSEQGVKMSGVEIHAQTTQMLLNNSYLQHQSNTSTILIILLLTLVPGIILARFQPVLAGGITVVIFIGYVVFAIVWGSLASGKANTTATYTIFDSVYPGLALLVTFIVIMLYRIVFEQAEQRATKGVMGKYLSADVMAEVLKDPDSLQLGGQKREMTVLFSDIRGFTSISEKMDPAALMSFLNEYLTAMTDIVFVNEGVLDKYIGDAVMAFWGAPKAQPNHAEMACRTAYQMIKKLHELQPGWHERGLPLINIGVGVNTGHMTVGNVGGSKRFDYTILGDSVNLGSRLEGTNKEYGTNIIISQTTLDAVQDKFVVRYLDLIAVKGKKEGVPIYELIAPVEDAAGKLPDGMLDAWGTAIELYKAQKFEEAQAAFQRVLEIRPEDGPAALFVARCGEMAVAPPGVEWDGVYVMTHK